MFLLQVLAEYWELGVPTWDIQLLFQNKTQISNFYTEVWEGKLEFPSITHRIQIAISYNWPRN